MTLSNDLIQLLIYLNSQTIHACLQGDIGGRGPGLGCLSFECAIILPLCQSALPNRLGWVDLNFDAPPNALFCRGIWWNPTQVIPYMDQCHPVCQSDCSLKVISDDTYRSLIPQISLRQEDLLVLPHGQRPKLSSGRSNKRNLRSLLTNFLLGHPSGFLINFQSIGVTLHL